MSQQVEDGSVMASGFAFECEYCGNIEMHRGQVPTATFGASQAQALGVVSGGYVEPNPPTGWLRVLQYYGGFSSSVHTFCSATCAMGHLGAIELEASNG